MPRTLRRFDSATRCDLAKLHAFHGRYGDRLLQKVSKVFPQQVF